MSGIRSFSPWLRAISIIGAVGVISTSVTFAALQAPPATLTNNSIETTSADLRIDKDGTSLTTAVSGFDFNGVTPGGVSYPAAGNTFYLKNVGAANLSVKAAVTTTPSVTTVQPNGATVDLSKVSFEFTRLDDNSVTALSLKSLIDGNSSGGVPLGTINAQTTVQYSLRVVIASDAFTAQSASISGITLAFTGVGI